MPFVRVTVCAPSLTGETVVALQAGVTALMAEILAKRADLTAVLVERVASGGWSVGGSAVSVAAHLDAKVTAGTNNPEQKAAFVAAAHQLMVETLGGDLPLATYVVVDEMPAESWGYAGLTQAQRARA